jgi:uncharacterized cupredoxin-like copper-binding protein
MATLDKEQEGRRIEEELHELEREEKQLEQRTDQLSLAQGLSGLASVLALIIGITALVVALIANGRTHNGTTMMRGAAPAVASSGSSGMPGGMMGGGPAAKPGVVRVMLGDMWVRPNVSSVPAGKVTFVASNMGHLPHELMIERTPLKMEGPGKPVEDAAQGMIDDMQPGQSGTMSLRLKPGSYQLFCNVPGHYAAGQHIDFTVTSG